MATTFPPFAVLELHQGNGQDLELIGIGTDGRLYLPAWQSHATGRWTIPSTNALSFQDGSFSALALGTGNSGCLQVLALGADQHIYLAAWQDSSGGWHPPSAGISGPLGDSARTYEAVAAHRGNSGFLQVFGLDTDGQIHLVVWQDQHGVWHSDGRRLANPGTRYTAVLPATGNSGYLQVLGLGADGQVYLAAWQDQNGGWHQAGSPIGNAKHRYAALAAANSSKGHLQVLGLGTDRKVYLAAWQDGGGGWHVSEKYGGPLGNESRPYASVEAHIGADRNLQVVCVGTDGKAYLATYQDKDGEWHAPSSKSNGPLGDPMTVYRALTLASGNNADKTHPGNLQVVGLGAGEADDGLPYLAAWQDRDGRWHAGMPLGKARSPIVNWESPTGQTADGACVAFGRLWVAQGSSIKSFDAITGASGRKLSSFPNNASPRVLERYGEELAVVCDDGNLYLADPDTGTISFKAQVGIPIWMAVAGGAVFVAGYDGVFRLAADGSVTGPYARGLVAAAPAVANGVLYVPIDSSTFGSKVEALDAATLSGLWTVNADGRPGPVFCDGSRLCFATESKSLYVYDVGSHAPVTPHGRPIGLAAVSEVLPIVNDGLCYVAFNDAVQAIDVKTGGAGRRFGPMPEPIGTPVLNENGVLFYGSIGPISVIDTAGASEGLVTYHTGGRPVLASYQDGALFYAAIDVAAAVRLDEAIHQYYAETSLVRDFDFSPGAAAATSTPNFQVEVALFDKDGSPRSGQPVRITATAPTTLTYQGQAASVSGTKFIDVTTDGAGRFRVAVAAGAQDRHGTFRQGLTAPELLLTSPFMDARMRLVIRPHGQLQQQLATISQDQLHGAKGYDEQNVVADDYRNNPKAMADATSAVRQVSGMVRTSMADTRKRDAGNLYCDPACDMTVACCMPASDPGCRVVCDQSFSFDLSLGASHFRLLGDEEARAAAAEISAGAALLSWDDFWDGVKTGAAKVTSAVIEAVADGARATIHFVTDVGPALVSGIVSAIEQATLLVQGIFNTIATAIHRVVEAVSFLFDWGKIVDLHDKIRGEVTATWDALATGVNGVSYDTIKAALDRQFGTAKREADAAFRAAKAGLGGQSVLDQQAASGQPKPVVGTAQGNWLLGKLQDNTVAPALSGRQASDGVLAAVSWPDFEPDQHTVSLFRQFLDTLTEKLSGDYVATIDRIREDLDVRSNTGLLARGLSVIIDILQGLVDAAIDVGQAVTDLLIDLLKAMINAVRDFVSKEIEIPYVSDLYEWATGSKLTLLGLFSLLIAIPTGFTLGLVSREPAYASGVSPLPPPVALRPAGLPARVGTPLPVGWITIAAGCAQTVWAVLSGALAGAELLIGGAGTIAKGLREIWRNVRLALTLPALFLVRGAFGAAIGFHQKQPDPMVWILWAVPTIIMTADVAVLALPGSIATDWALGDLVMVCGVIAGALMMLLGAIQFWTGAKTPGDGLALGFALAVGLSLLCRILVFTIDPKIKAGLIVAGAAALLASGVIEIARGAIGIGKEDELAVRPQKVGTAT